MNKRFLVLAGVATVLSVGTFVVLNKAKPYKHEEPKVADVTSPDQVFGASVDNPEAHAEGATAAAPAADGAAPAADAAAAVTPTDTAVQPAGSAAASAPAAGGNDGSVAALVPAGESAAAPAAAPATETAAAAPAAEPAAPALAAEPAPAAEAPAPAPVEKPKAAKKSAAKSTKSASGGKSWVPAENPKKLSLVYAGPASYKQAVVLMFNGAFFKPESANANITVTDKAGKAVSGTWETGTNNLRMVVFPVSAAGTYKVSIAPGLTDNKGRKFGTKLGGPIVVK